MNTVDLTKSPTPRPFRLSDAQALGLLTDIPLVTVAGVIHNDLRGLAELFAWSPASKAS